MNNLTEGTLIDVIEVYAKEMGISLYEAIEIIYEAIQPTGITLATGSVIVKTITSQDIQKHKQLLQDMLKMADYIHKKYGTPKEETIKKIIEKGKKSE